MLIENNITKDNIIDEDNPVEQVVKYSDGFISTIVYDWMSSLIIAVIAVIVLLTFCFRLIDVDGTSMESTLINTDKVIVTNLFYTPQNNDIVVISHGEEYTKPLVKRIIATAGQTLKIDFENNSVYVDGVLIDEPYIQGDTIQGNTDIPDVIPEGKVFVMGDNRAISLDSRYHEVGLIDVNAIIGKAQFVVIPHTYKDGAADPSLDLTKIRYLYD